MGGKKFDLPDDRRDYIVINTTRRSFEKHSRFYCTKRMYVCSRNSIYIYIRVYTLVTGDRRAFIEASVKYAALRLLLLLLLLLLVRCL